MDNYYVYEWIRCDTNEPFYVGKGKGNRCFDIKRNKHFKDVLKFCKEKSVGVLVSILNENLTEEEAYKIECLYIHEYVFEWGFNITNKTWGGEGGDIVSMMSEERKRQYSQTMSQSLKGKNMGPRSEEIKLKISETKKRLGIANGKNNPMYGKNIKDYMSESEYIKWKQNISKSLTGKKHSIATKEKMRLSALGKIVSTETREKMSIVNSGINNPMYGKKHSDNSKKLIAKGNEMPLVVKYKDGTKQFFESRNKCVKYFKSKYDVSMFTIKRLLSTGDILNSKYKKFQELNGLEIYYLDKRR